MYFLTCLKTLNSQVNSRDSLGLDYSKGFCLFFSEVIAWYGMAVVCNHLCIYLAWMVIVCYLAGRSHQTQLWYQKKIENFPKDRRNLFPGVY